MQVTIERCPFCGESEFILARQHAPEAYISAEALFGKELKHVVCRSCGSVVRSYVANPEGLLKKKNRKKD